jgi:5-methylcytosine-specific restriction endonuclease McrA
MKLIEGTVRTAGMSQPLSYYHAHWTRAGAPLLDALGAVIDHVEAFSTGGLSLEDNLATACNKCNTEKSASTSVDRQKRHPHKPIKGKYGEPQHWDGLSALFLALAERKASALTSSEKGWLKALRGASADAS